MDGNGIYRHWLVQKIHFHYFSHTKKVWISTKFVKSCVQMFLDWNKFIRKISSKFNESQCLDEIKNNIYSSIFQKNE